MSGHRIDNIADAMERAGLDDQERAVIDGMYSRDEPQKEIARRLGLTLYMVRRIEKSAREKIARQVETTA